MRKIIVLVLAANFLFACTKKETSLKPSKNYVPETPQLSSDRITPEVLWSFGRMGDAARCAPACSAAGSWVGRHA